MRQYKKWNVGSAIMTMVVVACAGASVAFATSSSSYQLLESEFSAGAVNNSCSGQYCAQASIGSLSPDDTSSTTSTAKFSNVKPDEPVLEVIIDQGDTNLGVLTPERTATKTATVRVRNYLSNGYIMQVNGPAPKYGTHTLATPESAVNSTQGSEQFGINAAANSTPGIGAAAQQVPSDKISFGVVNSPYNTPNKFLYNSGDTIAHSASSSGRTDYTISMIVNVSSRTPAGHYTGDFSIVVIPVY